MFLEKIGIVYRDRIMNFIIGSPMENVVNNVKVTPNPEKIVDNIELNDELIKIKYDNDEVTWLPVKKALELNFKEK